MGGRGSASGGAAAGGSGAAISSKEAAVDEKQAKITQEPTQEKLPELVNGSEKQIAWANKIRDGRIERIDAADRNLARRIEQREQFRREGKPGWDSNEAVAVNEQLKNQRANLKSLKARILQDKSAKSWIDHRNISIAELYRRVYKEDLVA